MAGPARKSGRAVLYRDDVALTTPIPLAGEPGAAPAYVGDSCAGCGRILAAGCGYAFRSAGRAAPKCLRCAVRHPPIVRKAAQTAAVVGTILTAINQGDALLNHHVTAALLWKVPLTYTVPYLVSTYGALSISRRE